MHPDYSIQDTGHCVFFTGKQEVYLDKISKDLRKKTAQPSLDLPAAYLESIDYRL
jgi:hypothetical protein